MTEKRRASCPPCPWQPTSARPAWEALALRVAPAACGARMATEMGRALQLRAASYDMEAGDLSGGNQQKVAIGKWLSTKPADDAPGRAHPRNRCRGEARDLPAHERVDHAGISILLVTSEMPELLAMSDRIVVMHRGVITAELPPGGNRRGCPGGCHGQGEWGRKWPVKQARSCAVIWAGRGGRRRGSPVHLAGPDQLGGEGVPRASPRSSPRRHFQRGRRVLQDRDAP